MTGSSTTVRRRMGRLLPALVAFALAGAVWELVARLELVRREDLPTAGSAIEQAASLMTDGEFLGQLAATLTAWALGLTLATLVAVPLGVALGSFRGAYDASRVVIEFLRPVPAVALIPLAILVFGQDLLAKVLLVLYTSCWPILFNTIYAVHDVDPVAKQTARSFGFGRLAILAKVSLPSASPFIASGVRIAAAIALTVVISTEFVAGSAEGLGAFLLTATSVPDSAVLVFAGILVAGLLGVGTDAVLGRAERRIIPWRAGSGGGA